MVRSTNRRMDAPRVDILIYECAASPDYAADQLDCHSGQPARINTLIVLALHVTGLFQPRWNALPWSGRMESADPLRNPIPGMGSCCALTAIGQAARPPTNLMNSRSFRPSVQQTAQEAMSSVPRRSGAGLAWANSFSVNCLTQKARG